MLHGLRNGHEQLFTSTLKAAVPATAGYIQHLCVYVHSLEFQQPQYEWIGLARTVRVWTCFL